MVFGPQLGVGSSAGNLATSPTFPTMLSGWSHLGIVLMALSISLEGFLCPETQWFSVCLHCIIVCLFAYSFLWLTGSFSVLLSRRLRSQGTGSSALLGKVSSLSLLHSFFTIFCFY